MTNKEKGELGALQRMRDFLDHNGPTLSSINRSPSRAELDELVVRVERHEADQRAAEVESRRLTQVLATRRTELRLEHMQPIAGIANVVLRDTPGFRPILMNKLTLVNDARLLGNATALGRTAAAHRPLFIAQQLPKDFITQLQAAAEAFRAAATERQVYWTVQAAATRGVADALRERRKVLPIVNALVVKALAGKADLLAAWQRAKQVKPIPACVDPKPDIDSGDDTAAVATPDAA